jgi:Double zinc ribbon
MTTPTPFCPACGAPAAGNFCSGCGASLATRTCPECQARLSPQARFCHRCGHAASLSSPPPSPPRPEGRERTAWLVAGGLCVLLLGALVLKVTGGISAAAVPDMANTGAGGAAPAGPAPDISQMTPQERFDRLFNRIMQAAEQRDSAQVERFLPMALGAYSQLDSPDADARYHAAELHLHGGDVPGALALADTILAAVPTHLFGYIVRGKGAALAGDKAGGTKAMRDFLAHYEAEMKADRKEYREHQPAIEEFRTASLAVKQP